jgi:hypothetical protein
LREFGLLNDENGEPVLDREPQPAAGTNEVEVIRLGEPCLALRVHRTAEAFDLVGA